MKLDQIWWENGTQIQCPKKGEEESAWQEPNIQCTSQDKYLFRH